MSPYAKSPIVASIIVTFQSIWAQNTAGGRASFIERYTFELLLLLTLIAFLFLLYWLISHHRRVKFTKASKLLLAEGFIDYNYRLNIFSNNGKHWYYVYFSEGKPARVLGKFIPAKVGTASWQKVVNYIYGKGPISYEDEAGINLLLKAGFKDGDHDYLTDADFKQKKPL